KTRAGDFVARHDEGVTVLAVDVDDATLAREETVSRGAKVALERQTFESGFGTVVRSEIFTPADLRYAFIERKLNKPGWNQKALLDQDLVVDRLESPSPFHLRVVDHLTNNVNMGEMKEWVEWYRTVFDFEVTRHFHIKT